MRKRTDSQRGDTIVEVLISVAIASMMLASAYAITSRNMRTTRDTQEHSQALQIAQQQVERLRALSKTETLGTLTMIVSLRIHRPMRSLLLAVLYVNSIRTALPTRVHALTLVIS